jgi:hypothetical protein
MLNTNYHIKNNLEHQLKNYESALDNITKENENKF